ncbi:MAG: Cna B-type domain-containing protein [Eubacteriales bacterium]|nr:Cna B-type domain-containing protein [Eubacteriales bacterium]
MRKVRNKILTFLLLAAVLTVGLLPAAVFAEDAAAEQKCTITVSLPAGGANYHLYKIGTADAKGNWQLDKEYQDLAGIDLKDKGAATMLEIYVRRDQKKPVKDAVTDQDGKASFADLEAGVYLLIGDIVKAGEKEYIPTPTLVQVPYKQENGEMVYTVDIQNKYKDKIPNQETQLTVGKSWESDAKAARPAEITVQLFDLNLNKVMAEQVLNEKNGWKFTWSKQDLKTLDPDGEWRVVEKSVPAGYKVTTEQKESVIKLTNTGTKNTPTPTPTPKLTPTPRPSTPASGRRTTTSRLPQTGQLWWPVSVCVILGMVLVLVGLILRRREH